MEAETKMILVVDDNPITARWVECLARRVGLNAVLAFDGEEALNRLTEEKFAAVISDVEMPGMNGFELLQNIHLLHPEIPVILMSAYCEAQWREAARAWGALALLEKPVNTDQLAALVGSDAEAHRNDPIKGMHVFSAA